MTDVRAATQLGVIAGIPVFAFYFLFVGGVIALEPLALISFLTVLSATCILLYFISKRTFQREEILTRWK